MGWFRADPASARAGSAGVTVSLLRPPSARRMTVRLRLGRDAVAATGWAADLRVELLWGDREHAGSVMVRPAAGGAADRGPAAGPRLRFPHQRSPNFLETTFGHVPHRPIAGPCGTAWTLPAEIRPAAEAGWRVGEDALVVTLPRAWWAVEERAAKGDARPSGDPRPSGTARPDPDDPTVQDTARHLLAKGCSLPELRARLRLDEDGFKALCAALREGGARRAVPRSAAPAEAPTDVKGELARIRERVSPNGSARP